VKAIGARTETGLLLDAERVDVAEGDVPCVEPVGVFGRHREERGRRRGEDDDEQAEAQRSGRGREPHSPHLTPHTAGTPVASAGTPHNRHCTLLTRSQLDTGVEAAGVNARDG
jgi:hypothetical protein